MTSETQVYEHALCEHLDTMVYRMKLIPADKWDWSPAVYVPSARVIARHTWSWLRCDRQHILETDCSRHERIPELGAQGELSLALTEETAAWRSLLRGMTAERLAEPRAQFGTFAVNVRWFVYHMIQHVVYKSGQLAELFFALGLDGLEPYDAPWPNACYDSLARALADPLRRALIEGDLPGLDRAVANGADLNGRNTDGETPLLLAVALGNAPAVDLLLRLGADAAAQDSRGKTALDWAVYLTHSDIAGLIQRALAV
ncbi:MAG TPA: ankyrin repeat domain-containing protein [Armatimonadota bacterium]|jgi:hypothetical protein